MTMTTVKKTAPAKKPAVKKAAAKPGQKRTATKKVKPWTSAEVHEALVEALGPISKSERLAIFGGTAARFYGIEAAGPT